MPRTSIPAVLRATEKHAWREEWLRMVCLLGPAVLKASQVIVLADRGLYAAWLFRQIVRLGWHPFLRINLGGAFRLACGKQFVPQRRLVPGLGSADRDTGSG
ncbi:MAG: hypothetical protein ACR2PL_13465 [Dehalococcoidia bacterium]